MGSTRPRLPLVCGGVILSGLLAVQCGMSPFKPASYKVPMETAPAPASESKKPSAPAQAESCYSLIASVAGMWSDADVILPPDRDPVVIEAEIKMNGELPAGTKETSRVIRWNAAGGTVKETSAGQGSVKAEWTMPSESKVTIVEAEAWITLESAAAGGKEKPLIVKKKVAFNFLPPVSSSLMKNGILDGYEIGHYLDPKHAGQKGDSAMIKKHPERYQVPPFFYRVDAASKGLKISPHLTLGHFVIDYSWGSLGMPQYIAIDPNLVQKMEDLIDLINVDGKFKISGVTPIYGFRSPKFNLGTIDEHPDTNLKVRYSMHQYGRAIDFIVDEDGDLIMDDLNGDGKHDILDAAMIMHYVNILDKKYREAKKMDLVGGAGIYERHDFVGRVQTPYIHVDTRGFVGSSGNLIRWKEPPPECWPDGKPIKWGSI
ncbi:hypothetical protein HYR69_05645 [Candidatus Sumerlaeota bacterium]|nr:hypothetical protein [Candidatus Sumerlaeota bacterium]MBI3734890.1 hypothetical protein [Candidatus Sumerlaeota bacterium]